MTTICLESCVGHMWAPSPALGYRYGASKVGGLSGGAAAAVRLRKELGRACQGKR